MFLERTQREESVYFLAGLQHFAKNTSQYHTMKCVGRIVKYSPALIGGALMVGGCGCGHIMARIAEIARPPRQFVSDLSRSEACGVA